MPSGAPPSFPLRAVAALFLARQHLDRPRARRLTAPSLTRFVTDTGGLQIDSINVIDRAHYLTVWSRFGPYDRRAFDRLVYQRRVLFEYWAHAACLVPAEHFAWWRRAMLDYSLRTRGWGRWLQRNQPLVTEIEAAIATGGPLGSGDFQRVGKPRAGGWWSWKPATHALDYLWMSGRALIHSRVHFQKRFDLAERVMADALTHDPPSAEEFRRWHLRRSLHAMGAATVTDLRMYLTFPRIEAGERRRVLAELLASGEVVEIAVDDERRPARQTAPWFVLARDLRALAAAAGRRSPSRGTTMLTPFDSFLWHRERTERLFGFSYKIEVYTPGPKRKHGYYVLPILCNGQLIGRLDAKTHRQERRLEVKRVHFEPWFALGREPPAARWGGVDGDEGLAGVADALRALAAFVGADSVVLGRVSPARLAPPLRRALRTSPAPAPLGGPELKETLTTTRGVALGDLHSSSSKGG
jgi:uncharacterized protein YcaQ